MHFWYLGAFGTFKIGLVVEKCFIFVGGTSLDVQSTTFLFFESVVARCIMDAVAPRFARFQTDAIASRFARFKTDAIASRFTRFKTDTIASIFGRFIMDAVAYRRARLGGPKF